MPSTVCPQLTAGPQLLRVLTEEGDLMLHLRCVKHFFLMDQGDYLVHFLDMASPELAKKKSDISVSKLESLLDIALRQSAPAELGASRHLSFSLLPVCLLSLIN